MRIIGKKYMLLLFVMIIGLIGCGPNNNDETNNVDENTIVEETEENLVIEEHPPSIEEVEQIEYPQFINDEQPDERIVKMVTNRGAITMRLFPRYAPLAVENFLTHSENGYYDGVIFHRVIEGFVIQAGDPTGTGAGGESIYEGPFEDEFSPSLGHFRGALSMANAGPNTNQSQFFIVQKKTLDEGVIAKVEQQLGLEYPEGTVELYNQYGGLPSLDYRHTVFGHVIEGMDVVDRIAKTEVDGNDKPSEEVVIESIEILN